MEQSDRLLVFAVVFVVMNLLTYLVMDDDSKPLLFLTLTPAFVLVWAVTIVYIISILLEGKAMCFHNMKETKSFVTPSRRGAFITKTCTKCGIESHTKESYGF